MDIDIYKERVEIYKAEIKKYKKEIHDFEESIKQDVKVIEDYKEATDEHCMEIENCIKCAMTDIQNIGDLAGKEMTFKQWDSKTRSVDYKLDSAYEMLEEALKVINEGV